MKIYFFKYFLILILCDFIFSFCLSKSYDSNSKNVTQKLENLLPDSTEINDWIAQGESENAVGQDLYLVINGGAEIYHEYGFKNAIYQTYVNNGNSINLEIYEMQSNTAAFGMYSFKTGKEGLSLNLGYEGWLESYYLNFWKGNYLVTLTSMKTDSSCIEDLINFANAVDKRIICTSVLPPLVSYLPEEHLQKISIKYLKGNLGLFNQDIFGPKNIFGLRKGVIGEYPAYLILIIKYQINSESMKWYKSAANHFKNSDEYIHFAEYNTHFRINDLKDHRLWIKTFNNFIIIIRGKEIINANILFNNIEEKISQ